MPGMNMFPSGSTLQIPLDACTNFASAAGNAQITLTWTDPKDKYATPEGETAQDPDQLVSVWEYTQIIRKTGSQPAGPHDGELVVSSSVRDQYATTGFVDDGLTNDTLYYYAAYAYNTDGVASEGAFTSATPMAGTPLSELAEGTLIKILENGSPVEFYVAKQNYEEGLNGSGRALCVRKDIYQEGAWDAGNVNAYASSTIDTWLNGAYKSILSNYVKTFMQTTKFYYTPGNGTTSLSTLQRSVFQLSCTELGLETSYSNTEGTALPNANLYNITDGGIYAPSQWTRSPDLTDKENAVYVYNTGEGAGAHYTASRSNYFGYRPCFTLPSTALVDQDLNLIES